MKVCLHTSVVVLCVPLMVPAAGAAQQSGRAGVAESAGVQPPPAVGAQRPDPNYVPAPSGDALASKVVDIGPRHIMNLLLRGDLTMWALLLCSVVTVTFILERLIMLRASRVIPPKFVDRFLDRLRDDTLEPHKALEFCRDNGSPVANIFAIIAQHWGRPAAEIRRAVADRADCETYPLRRRIRALGGIATMAPLLGLFGTVIGMIRAFHALSLHAGPGKTELLAEGISLALVATASGLAIAIVAAAAYYMLGARVERLVQEIDLLAHEVIDHVASDESAPTRPRVVPAAKRASL